MCSPIGPSGQAHTTEVSETHGTIARNLLSRSWQGLDQVEGNDINAGSQLILNSLPLEFLCFSNYSRVQLRAGNGHCVLS